MKLRPRGLVAAAIVLLAGWLAGATWWPYFRPTTAFPGTLTIGAVQALAFGPQIAVVLLAIGILVLVRSVRRGRGARALVLPLVAVLLSASVLPPTAGLVASPGPTSTAASEGRTLQVVAWNVHSEVTSEQLGELLAGTPAVVVLPESDPKVVRAELGSLGKVSDYQVFATETDPEFVPTTVLIASSLGVYRPVPGNFGSHGTLVLDPADARSAAPRIVGVHTASPRWALAMRLWRDHLRHVVDEVCTRAPGGRPVVATGDFNAVSAHGLMSETAARGCTDVLPASGVHEGTWPSYVPLPLRAQIDHVLVGPGVTAAAAALPRIAGDSDHRPISATVRY